MKFRTILSLFLIFLLIGTAGAVTTIPAGWVNNYNLESANTVYKLAGDVNANSTAFSFGQNNVTLDMMGHTVSFARKTAGWGILNTKNNCTIKNGSIVQSNYSLSNGHALYLYNSNFNTNIINVTTLSGSGYGIYLRYSSHNHISNSSFRSISSNGMLVDGTSTGNIVTDSNITSTNSHGMWESGAGNTTFINCRMNALGSGNGAYLLRSNYNTLQNCVVSSASGNPIRIMLSRYNTISTLTPIPNSQHILYMDSARNNSVVNSTINSTVNQCIYMTNLSTNNSISGNRLTSTTSRTIRIFNSIDNMFANNILSSPYEYAPASHSILVLGDSISAGGATGVPVGAWGLNVSDYLNQFGEWYVSNQAMGGETAATGLARYEMLLDLYTPSYVTILYGRNDIGASRPQQDIIDDVLEMAYIADNRGIVPYILLTPSTSSSNNQNIYLDTNLTAQAHALGYTVINTYDAIDLVPSNGQYDGHNATNFIADGIHPNNIGNTLIANAVYNAIIDDLIPEQYWYDWDTTNESCIVKVDLVNSTPTTTWNLVLTNTTDGNIYSLYNPSTGNIIQSIQVPYSSTFTVTGLSDGTYWIQESSTFDTNFLGIKDSLSNDINSSFLLMGSIMLLIIGIATIALLASAMSGQLEYAMAIMAIIVLVLIGTIIVIGLTILSTLMDQIR